jgi:hypothetical protein
MVFIENCLFFDLVISERKKYALMHKQIFLKLMTRFGNFISIISEDNFFLFTETSAN